MFPQVKSAVDAACQLYPPVALGFCTYGIVSERRALEKAPQEKRQERLHTILNLSIAIGALMSAYFSPVLSHALNGTYYTSCYKSDLYNKTTGTRTTAWRRFLVFGAIAAFGLAASSVTALPWTALVATRVAGQVLTVCETALFLRMTARAAPCIISHLQRHSTLTLPYYYPA